MKTEIKRIDQRLIEQSLKTQSTSTSNKLSIYNDELTKEGVKLGCVKILAAFKNLDTTFTSLLAESLKRNNFTDNRFADAVNHVIDNCVYPTPSIADFIGFDRSVKLFTYSEMLNCNLGTDGFVAIKINPDQDKPSWVTTSDYQKYGLSKFKI